MKEKDYFEKLDAALHELGMTSRHVGEDDLGKVAHYAPTDVLEAVVHRRVLKYNEKAKTFFPKSFNPKWTKVCDEELSERMLIGDDSLERDKSPEEDGAEAQASSDLTEEEFT